MENLITLTENSYDLPIFVFWLVQLQNWPRLTQSNSKVAQTSRKSSGTPWCRAPQKVLFVGHGTGRTQKHITKNKWKNGKTKQNPRHPGSSKWSFWRFWVIFVERLTDLHKKVIGSGHDCKRSKIQRYKVMLLKPIQNVTSGRFLPPIWTYMLVKLDHFPKKSGWTSKKMFFPTVPKGNIKQNYLMPCQCFWQCKNLERRPQKSWKLVYIINPPLIEYLVNTLVYSVNVNAIPEFSTIFSQLLPPNKKTKTIKKTCMTYNQYIYVNKYLNAPNITLCVLSCLVSNHQLQKNDRDANHHWTFSSSFATND